MYYMCIYTCTYKEREGGEGERDTTSTCSCIHFRGGREGGSPKWILFTILGIGSVSGTGSQCY